MTTPPDMTVPPVPATPGDPVTSLSDETGVLPRDEDAERTHSEADRSLLGLVRLPERRATILALIVAVLVAAVCWYFGVDVWHSVLLGSVLTTVGLISMVGTTEGDLGNTDWQAARCPTGTARAARSPSCPGRCGPTTAGSTTRRYPGCGSSPGTDWRSTSST